MEVIFKNPNKICQVLNIYYRKKELVESYVGLDGDKKVVEVMIYTSRNHKPRVSINKIAYGYVEVRQDGKRSRSGICKIQGGNYRYFPSVVTVKAFKNAGIEFSEDIEGYGTESIKRCILTLLEHIGCKQPIVTSITNR